MADSDMVQCEMALEADNDDELKADLEVIQQADASENTQTIVHPSMPALTGVLGQLTNVHTFIRQISEKAISWEPERNKEQSATGMTAS